MNWGTNPRIKIKNKGGNNMGKQKNLQNSHKKEKPMLSDDDEINEILNLNHKNVNIVIEMAEKFSKEIKYIPSSKLRDFYDYVVQIEESMHDNDKNWYLRLMLLKPKMTYQASKETNGGKRNALKIFEKKFTKFLNAIECDETKFKNFKMFFEAVVAYHRKHNNQ